MKATVLTDNTSFENMEGEWGLSIYFDYEGAKLLLDMGKTELYLQNAEKLGLSIPNVEYAVISHAHNDHAGGLRSFFRENSRAKLYLQNASAGKYYIKKWIFKRYIGLEKNICSEFSDRIIYTNGVTEIADGVYIVPHSTAGLDAYGKRDMMYRRNGRQFVPDDFSHEQSLVFDTESGLVIFNSCSHGGADNIINEVSEAIPGKAVYGIIGGFHLYNKTETEIRTLARKIKETDIKYVCTGHCTKERAYSILQEELGDRLHKLHVGLEMNF